MVSMEVESEKSVENTDNSSENSKRKLNKTILDNFSNLIKPHEGVRIKSSVNLLKYLSETSVEKVGALDKIISPILICILGKRIKLCFGENNKRIRIIKH